jgi:hypothetical protein
MSERDDERIHGADHEELVAVLNRLYVDAGEPKLASSSARAMTDDELRVAIRTLRSRLAAKSPAHQAPSKPKRTHGPAMNASSSAGRRFCVLYTSDAALITQAKAHLRSRGVPVIAVDSAETLAAVASQTMPTAVVIDARSGALRDVTAALGPRAYDTALAEGSDADAVLAAVFALVP